MRYSTTALKAGQRTGPAANTESGSVPDFSSSLFRLYPAAPDIGLLWKWVGIGVFHRARFQQKRIERPHFKFGFYTEIHSEQSEGARSARGDPPREHEADRTPDRVAEYCTPEILVSHRQAFRGSPKFLPDAVDCLLLPVNEDKDEALRTQCGLSGMPSSTAGLDGPE